MKPTLLTIAILLLLLPMWAAGQEFDSKHQFSLGSGYDFSNDALMLEAYWIPELSFSADVYRDFSLDADYSFIGKVQSRWGEENSADISLEHYRYWLRMGLPQTDVRVGLQRISFGSAKVLRPLQWFDRVNPLDASEFTAGVKAALFTHNWLNNSNIWLWEVLGEDEMRITETIPGKKNSIETGGRLQVPGALGESGVAFHHRKLRLGEEYRLGLDHRYDGPIGAWVELCGNRFEIAGNNNHQVAATLGLDYTLGLGNGLALTAENMQILLSGDKAQRLHNESGIVALMASYPLGLLDNLTILATHMHNSRKGNLAIVWRRAYDYLSWDLSLGLDTGYDENLSTSPSIAIKLNYNL